LKTYEIKIACYQILISLCPSHLYYCNCRFGLGAFSLHSSYSSLQRPDKIELFITGDATLYNVNQKTKKIMGEDKNFPNNPHVKFAYVA